MDMDALESNFFESDCEALGEMTSKEIPIIGDGTPIAEVDKEALAWAENYIANRRWRGQNQTENLRKLGPICIEANLDVLDSNHVVAVFAVIPVVKEQRRLVAEKGTCKGNCDGCLIKNRIGKVLCAYTWQPCPKAAE